MGYLNVIVSAAQYEFLMQVRRQATWVVLVLMCLLVFGLWQDFYIDGPEHPPTQAHAILVWVQFIAMIVPIGIGLVLADRLARDRTTQVSEIFDTYPSSLFARLLGKYIGSTAATLLPVVLCYILGTIIITSIIPGSEGWPLAFAAFAAVPLPGILFVAGFSLMFPVALKVPLYQILFVGYWFWANLMSPRIGLPSLVGTMLNATGLWAQRAFFHYHFQFNFIHIQPTILQGIASIALLTGLGIGALFVACEYLHWQRSR